MLLCSFHSYHTYNHCCWQWDGKIKWKSGNIWPAAGKFGQRYSPASGKGSLQGAADARVLTSQQHASVSQGPICSDNCTCCHTEIEVTDPTFYLTQSQHTDTGPTSPSADPITPGAWQGSHWSANFLSHWYDSTKKNPGASGI